MSDPVPILGYGGPASFGWRTDGDDHVLVLPPALRLNRLVEAATALFASTGFMLLFGTVAVARGRLVPPAADPMRLMLLVVGLAAIGQWVLVLMRFVTLARAAHVPATVRVTPDALAVTDALAVNPDPRAWPRAAVAGLRLDVVRRFGRGVVHARLQVTSGDGTIAAVNLPWPPAEPAGPHEARLRELLALPAPARHAGV